MSVIIRNEEGKLTLLCKGADSVMFERLAKNGQKFEEKTKEHIDEYADAGLRTLVLAYRELDEEEYKEFERKFSAAKNSVSADRESLIDKVTDRMERNLILLGATAVEDKLQDGVPECIDKLAQAGIKIWVLTGDKMETAINIGFACSLPRQGMKQIIVTLETPEIQALERTGEKDMIAKASKESVIHKISRAKAQLTSSGSSEVYALIIDGKSLAYALEDDVKDMFFGLAVGCASVICCRSSPKQKAMVTKLVKVATGKTTLGIGDGANDVGMIQEADIGIGISGAEGMQAVMSSDIAIAQFKYLERLLLVHGHWCYRRLSTMVIPFTKMNALTFMFHVQCMISFFPLLYQQGVQNVLFSWGRIISWMFNGFCSAMIIFFFCTSTLKHQAFNPDGKTAGRDILGATMLSCVIWVVNSQMALAVSYFTLLQHICIWASIFIWYMFLMIYGAFPSSISGNAYRIFIESLAPTSSYWFLVFFVVISTLIPFFIYSALQMNFFPMYHEKIQWVRHQGQVNDPEFVNMVRQRSLRPTTVGFTARLAALVDQL